MQNILSKIGIIVGVSAVSSFVSSTVIAMLVGFLLYNVISWDGHILEVAGGKFLMATVFVWPIGSIGGVIGGFIGWATGEDGSDINRRIVKWSVVGALLVSLLPACFVGANTIT